MPRNLRPLLLCAGLLAAWLPAARPLLAQAATPPEKPVDLSGIWTGQVTVRNGLTQEIAFQFAQNGSRLSGKLYGDYRSSPIVEGIVSGRVVTFVVAATEQAGNQINDSRLRFTGNLQGDQLHLVREREASTNAGNKGDSITRPGNTPKQPVLLKRLD